MNQWSTEPSLGRLDAGHAEHAQKALLDLGRVALEVLAHGGERRLGRGDHVVADCLLLIERVRLRRVQADAGAEVCQLLLLPQLFPTWYRSSFQVSNPSIALCPGLSASKEFCQEESRLERFFSGLKCCVICRLNCNFVVLWVRVFSQIEGETLLLSYGRRGTSPFVLSLSSVPAVNLYYS